MTAFLQAPILAEKAEELKSGEPQKVRLAAVVSALSQALDLSTGQPPGHSIRACIIGMRIGQQYGLSAKQLDELFYALLLKDCGCSGNASKTFHALVGDDLKAKRDVKTTNWTSVGFESLQYALTHVAVGKPFLERVQALFNLAVNQKAHTRDVTKIRCERGSTLARLMGLPEGTAAAILDLDEHWDGSGLPDNLRGDGINLYARIMLMAQTLENFAADQSKEAAVQIIQQRSKKWFDPALVKVAMSLAANSGPESMTPTCSLSSRNWTRQPFLSMWATKLSTASAAHSPRSSTPNLPLPLITPTASPTPPSPLHGVSDSRRSASFSSGMPPCCTTSANSAFPTPFSKSHPS